MSPTVSEIAVLCVTALLAGAVNSVAGGGTLLTFPALIAILEGSGDPAVVEKASVIANGTSTVALLPGSIAGLWGYRREMEGQGRWIAWLIGPSLVGGIVGTLLVVWKDEAFKQLVPWLILVATLLLALQPAIARWTGIGKPHDVPDNRTMIGIALFQLVIAVYGGYFGAGIGILMLSALAMMGLSDIHRMNGLKSLLGVTINGVSAVVWIASGIVRWDLAVPMTIAAIAGGYLGASFARRLDKNLVRRFVIVIGLCLAARFFWTTYRPGAKPTGPEPATAPGVTQRAAPNYSTSPRSRGSHPAPVSDAGGMGGMPTALRGHVPVTNHMPTQSRGHATPDFHATRIRVG